MTFASEVAKINRKPLEIIEFINDAVNAPLIAPSDSSGAMSLWHCKGTAPFGHTAQIYGSVESIRYTPTRLQIGEGLGDRGIVKIIFRDFPVAGGSTYFNRFKGANTFFLDRKVKIYDGFIEADGTFDLANNFQERLYFIRKINGPDLNGRVVIECADVLSRLRKEAVLPQITTEATLATSLTAGATPGNFNIGDNTDFTSTPIPAVIEDELVVITTAEGNGEEVTIGFRGSYGTEDKAHDAGVSIAPCYLINNENPIDAIRDIINTFIPGYIDDTEWDAERDERMPDETVFRVISEATEAREIINSICADNFISVWWDDVAQLIKVRAIGPTIESSSVLNDEEHLLDTTHSVNIDQQKAITQVWVYYSMINQLEDPEEVKNYQSLHIGISSNADLELLDAYGVSRIKKVFAPNVTSASAAIRLAVRNLAMYEEGEITNVFELDAKDAASVEVGQNVGISSSVDTTANGSNKTRSYIIIEKDKQDESKYRFKAIADGSLVSGTGAIITDDTVPPLCVSSGGGGSGCTYESQVLTLSPLHYHKFNGANETEMFTEFGTGTPASPGSAVGPTSIVSSPLVLNQSTQSYFNDISGYLRPNWYNNLTSKSVVSFVFWVRETQAGSGARIIYFAQQNGLSTAFAGILVGIDSSGYFYVGGRSSSGDSFQSYSSTTTFTTDTTYMVYAAIDFANDTFYLSIDGSTIESGAATFANTTSDLSSNDSLMGFQFDTTAQDIVGRIDQPSAWDRLLTQNEIDGLYAHGTDTCGSLCDWDAQVQTHSPRFWYKCDDTSGFLFDSGSRAANSVQLNSGGITYEQDKLIQTGTGKSIAINGAEFNAGVVSNDLNGVSSWAFMCWIKPTTVSGTQRIMVLEGSVDKYFGASVALVDDDLYFFTLSQNSDSLQIVQLNTVFTADTIHFIYCDVDYSTGLTRVSVDGSAFTTLTATYGSSTVTFGGESSFFKVPAGFSGGGTQGFVGDVDEMVVLKSAVLDISQVQELYDHGINACSPATGGDDIADITFLQSDADLAYRTDAAIAGKIYFEVNRDSGGINGSQLGFMIAATKHNTKFNYQTGAANIAGVDLRDGSAVGVGTGTNATVGSGESRIGVAIDAVNNKLWVRDSTGWTGDPATNTGGIDISALTDDTTEPTTNTDIYAVIGQVGGDTTAPIQFDVIFSSATFGYLIPSGFSAYNNSTMIFDNSTFRYMYIIDENDPGNDRACDGEQYLIL